MSKELIVSATRHETRVAVIEDDQVVEIFYQREKEYSLAGSIHKGRVTRVLPGMQSAFVDIGLDRDAFLYVSDFFEDNDEYDKIVTGVEEKVLRLDKSPPAIEAVTADYSIASTIESTAADVASPEPGNTQTATELPVFQGGRDRSSNERRDDRQRGGRGRRRGGRRGPGGPGGSPSGGLPESKYFSPRQQSRPAEVEVAREPRSVAVERTCRRAHRSSRRVLSEVRRLGAPARDFPRAPSRASGS